MLNVQPIGLVRTKRTVLDDTPVQAAANLGEEGVAVVDERFRPGLEGLAGFSHLWLLTWLGGDEHHFDDAELHQRPFLRPEGPPVGIFAMRTPRRPVPIGLSLVEVVAVDDTSVTFRGVDVIDGTLLLDLKPFFPDADHPRTEVRSGWFDEIAET